MSTAITRSHTHISRTVRPSGTATRASFKRLIVCCDGTWLDAASDIQHGKLVPPSNVARLTRAVRSESSDGVQQVIYYQAGLGSTGTASNKAVSGMTAAGLAENVREAYTFIANNYDDGDEIFLIGFSRGAFTARSVAGLIGQVGVMRKVYLDYFPVVYKDFTHRRDRSYRSPLPDIPFPDKPPFRNPEYVREMRRRGITKVGVRIRAVAVFDTVGSLGIPKVGWLGRLGQRTIKEHNEYAFYDTTLDECIDNAFQALAIDEKRAPFQPAVWEKRRNDRTNLIQVWFPGVHANIGGGYDDQELSNITLAWMMAMLAPLLDLDLDYIIDQGHDNQDYYDKTGQRQRPWSFGKIYNSVTGLFTVAGTTTRTPGNYHRLNPQNGEPTNKPLVDTHEYVHASVRSREVLRGPGYNDKGDYQPKAMQKWRLRGGDGSDGLPSPWYWEDETDRDKILPEAPLRQVEKMLLRMSPETYDYVMEPPHMRRKTKRG